VQEKVVLVKKENCLEINRRGVFRVFLSLEGLDFVMPRHYKTRLAVLNLEIKAIIKICNRRIYSKLQEEPDTQNS
jgi:hypothetical protein